VKRAKGVPRKKPCLTLSGSRRGSLAGAGGAQTKEIVKRSAETTRQPPPPRPAGRDRANGAAAREEACRGPAVLHPETDAPNAFYLF